MNGVLGDVKDILTNVYGIIGVVLAIAGTFAGGAAVGRLTAPDPAPKATAEAAASPSATPSRTPTPSVTTSATVIAEPSITPIPTGITNLSSLKPLQSPNVANFSTGPVQIGSKTYPQSVRFQCYSVDETSLVYNVAGFKFLDVTIGVPNDAPNAAGNITVFTFLKNGSTTPLGDPVSDVTGQPQTIHLDLQGSAQLEIACSATNATTHGGAAMDVTLGDATLTP